MRRIVQTRMMLLSAYWFNSFPFFAASCTLSEQKVLNICTWNLAKDDEPEYEPGARNPVGVELVGRHRLEKFLLVLRHEAGVDHVVQRREPLLHCG